jgi:hypothetical protein
LHARQLYCKKAKRAFVGQPPTHSPPKTTPDVKGPMEARRKIPHQRHATSRVAHRVEDGRALSKTCDTGFMGQTSVKSATTRHSFTCMGFCRAERKHCETVETASFCDVLRARKAAARTWGCVKSRSKACHRAERPGLICAGESCHSFVCSNINFAAVPSQRQRGSDP